MKDSWLAGLPVWNRLPWKGYKDNPIAKWLTEWVDLKLTEVAAKAQLWYREVDPDTCQDSSLDYLGYLVGLSGRFWDTNWSPTVKRALIRISHQYLWHYRGTIKVIRRVLDIHGINYDIWQPGQLLVPFRVTARIGSGGMRLFIRLTLSDSRTSANWREAQRTADNFVPAVTSSRVVYRRFYAGYSIPNDPVFDEVGWLAPEAGNGSLRVVPGMTFSGNLNILLGAIGGGQPGLTRFSAQTFQTDKGGTVTIAQSGAYTYLAPPLSLDGSSDSFDYSVFNDKLGSQATVIAYVSDVLFDQPWTVETPGTALTQPASNTYGNPYGYSYASIYHPNGGLSNFQHTAQGLSILGQYRSLTIVRSAAINDYEVSIEFLVTANTGGVVWLRLRDNQATSYDILYNPYDGAVTFNRNSTDIPVGTFGVMGAPIVPLNSWARLTVRLVKGRLAVWVNGETQSRLSVAAGDVNRAVGNIAIVPSSTALNVYRNFSIKYARDVKETLIFKDTYGWTGTMASAVPQLDTTGLGYIWFGFSAANSANGSLRSNAPYSLVRVATTLVNADVRLRYRWDGTLSGDNSLGILTRVDINADSQLLAKVFVSGLVVLYTQVGQTFVTLGSAQTTGYNSIAWHSLSIFHHANTAIVRLDGNVVLTVVDTRIGALPAGTAHGFVFGANAGNIEVDDFEIYN